MTEEKPLNPDNVRKAFAAISQRLQKLEEKVRDQSLEAETRTAYIRNVQAKIDKYCLELDHALPRITAAEAQLGRANANHDKLWSVLVNTNEGISRLRDLVRDTLEKTGDVGEES